MIIDEVCSNIEVLLQSEKPRICVAIEGRAAAGKTTLAGMIADNFDCNVFHADDYFLQQLQRSSERLSEPGGNIDYERMKKEIILPLVNGGDVVHSAFDCVNMRLCAPHITGEKRLNIVEGSYCLHPYFGDWADYRIFLDVEPEDQRIRIESRNPDRARMFFERWIPMENRYFSEFGIPEECEYYMTGLTEECPDADSDGVGASNGTA